MASFGGGGFSHKAPMLSTDMRCYFQCPQAFKKDYDLRLHLKIRHKGEDPEELERAYQDAEDEIALVTRSLSTYECALCSKTYNEAGPFYDHIRKVHNMQWLEYKDRYGRCETKMGSFECKICGRVVKYDRECIHSHLKKVHNIQWAGYVDRIRKMRQGVRPTELPNIEMFQCKICNSTVKYDFRKKHLQGIHKITEQEYVQLFGNGEAEGNTSNQNDAGNNGNEAMGYSPMESNQPLRQTIQQPNIGYSQAMYPDYNNNQEPNHFNPSKMQDTAPMGYQNTLKPSEEKRDYVDAVPALGNPIPTEIKGPPKPTKIEIQDKTNTGCSSCNMNFQTRREFIEHCTSVHNMKFRTKSGATISSATMSLKNEYNREQNNQVFNNSGTIYDNSLPMI